MKDQLLTKLTKESVSNYQKHLAEELKLSPATVKRRLSSIRKFCEWAQKEDYIEENPFAPQEHLEGVKAHLRGDATRGVFPFLTKAYKTYHSLSITKYFHYAILIIFCAALGYGAYDQFFRKAPEPLAYPAALTPPNRYLSFQGRLTDSSNNPITTATNFVFKLYDAATDGNTLWNSGTCSITPDQDGIFSVLLGSDCGAEIDATVFTENASVWLGVTVGADSEATPRIQIATVGYALNAETLQGYPPGTDTSTIPYIDSTGKLTIAAASPTIESSSGTFGITGQALSITTAAGTDGDITLAPDGSGVLNLTLSSGTGNVINATDANLGASGGKEANTLYYGSVANDNTNVNLLKLESGATPIPKFTVDASGNASLSGQLRLGNFGSDPTAVGKGAMIYKTTDDKIYYWNGSSWTEVGSGSGGGDSWWTQTSGILYPVNETLDLAIGGTSTASANVKFGASSGSDSFIAGGNFGIGTTSPDAKLHIEGGEFWLFNSGSNPRIIIGDSGDTGQYGYLQWDSTNDYYRIETDGVNGLKIKDNNVSIGNIYPSQPLIVGSGSTELFRVDTSGKVGIGRASPSMTLDVDGDATVSGTLSLGPQVQAYAGTCDASSAGKMYYDGTTNQVYYCNGSSWVVMGSASSVFGSGTANYIPKWQDSSTLTDSVLYESGGNVGIGTTGPSFPLTITRSGYSTPNIGFQVYDNSLLSSSLIDIAGIRMDTGGTAHFESGKGLYLHYNTRDLTGNRDLTIAHGSASTPVLTIKGGDTNGNVGIGTTSPGAKLENIGTTLLGSNLTGAEDALYVNAGSGFTGNLLKLAVNSTEKFSIDYTGMLTTASGVFTSTVADGASAIGFKLNTSNEFTDPGSKLLSIQNNGAEKFAVDYLGNATASGVLTSLNSSSSITNTAGDITIDAASNNISFASDNLINIGDITVGGTASISGTPNLTLIPTTDLAKIYLLNGGDLGFYTSVGGDTGVAEKIRITNEGNVGIGTTEASEKLHIYRGNIKVERDWGDISTASYDGVSFYVGSQDTVPTGLAFKSDGTKMYIVGYTDKVYQYTLSAGWDLSTASYDNISFSIAGGDDYPQDLAFKSDGTKMYVMGWYSNKVYQYTLSAGWDLSTASYDNISFYVGSQDDYPTGLAFKSDGTKMYIVGDDNNRIYQYSLSTAWDISTASYDGVSFYVGSQETHPRGLPFKSDGTKMYIVGDDNDRIYQYSLSTAWDISTASYDGVSFYVGSQDAYPTDLAFKSDGTKMYVMGTGNDTVYQYTVAGSYIGGNILVDGNVGIGTTDPGSYKLNVAGEVAFNSGNIYSDSSNYFYAARFVDSANTDYFVDPAATGTAGTFYGSVGIGTTSPSYKLDVSGDINFTGALREDGVEILSGMIAAFASSCPTGWTEYTAARGRTIVGTPSGGTIAGTVGTALSNLGTRTITDVPSHYHSVDPPSTNTNTTGSHKHSVYRRHGGTSADVQCLTVSNYTTCGWQSNWVSSAGSHYHTVNIPAFNSASTGVSAVDVTMPYIQLTYCKKNAGADLAEWIPASEDISQETIVSIDPNDREKIIASRKPYDPTVVGIIATQPGWLIGDEEDGSVQMALAGRVPTRVSLMNGEIKPGDAITTSPIPGVGMKATKSGPIVGKAMEALNETSSLTNCLNPETGVEEKCGTVLVFVNISWFSPSDNEYQEDTLLAQASSNYYELLRFQDDLTEGDLVSLEYGQAPNEYDPEKMETVTYISKTNYNSKTFVGAISNTIGGKGELLKRERVNNQIISETRLISYGNARVKISPSSEPIQPGDPLVLSEIPGMAMKATKVGPTIAKALESWDPESNKQTIRAFIGFGWYDPNIYFTSIEEVQIISYSEEATSVEESEEGHCEGGTCGCEGDICGEENFLDLVRHYLTDSAGKIIDRIGVFSKLIAANLQAGKIETKELVSPLIESKQIDTLIINTNSIETKRISLAEIDSSDCSENIIIHLGGVHSATSEASSSSAFGRLIIKGEEGQEVASIDAEGNASFSGQLSAESLEVEKDATIAGTLYADEIITKHGRFGDLIASTISATYITQNITNVYESKPQSSKTSEDPSTSEVESTENTSEVESEASPSATASPSAVMSDEEIEALIAEILETPIEIPLATAEADLASLPTLKTPEVSLPTSGVDGVVDGVDGGLTVLGPTSLADTTIAGSLNIGGTLALADNSINSLSGTLYLQNLGLGGVDILAGKIVIDTSGNLTVEGDVTIKGKLAANIISPLPEQDLVIDLAQIPTSQESFQDTSGEMNGFENTSEVGFDSSEVKSGFGKFLVKGVDDKIVASIDASGSAFFASLGLEADYSATQSGAIVAAYDNWLETGEYSPAIKTNAAAGVGILPAYESEIMIYNPKITEQSLIYITPITDTANKVIYVKAKKAAPKTSEVYPFGAEGAEGPSTSEVNEPGWFKVGIDTPINKDIKFNWWIVGGTPTSAE